MTDDIPRADDHLDHRPDLNHDPGPVDPFDPGVMAGRLTRWADGLGDESRAVAVLVAHGTWLRDERFLDECVFLIEPDGAAIDWLQIPVFLAGCAAPPLDAQVLTVAGRLARQRAAGVQSASPWPLEDERTQLDRTDHARRRP